MYVVTGGAGFIGSAFVARLNAEGVDDILLVDELASSDKWKNIVGRRFSDYLHKDQFLKSLHDGAFDGKKIGAIIHMGACSSTTESDLDFLLENNYRYSQHLAEYAQRHHVRFIYASSGATYGDGSSGYMDDHELLVHLRPLNRYGYSKQLFDLWLLRNALLGEVVGLKFFNVYGPNEYHKGEMCSVVSKAYSQIQETGQVKLFKSYLSEYKDGEQKRDFVYIKDCLDVMWWMLEHPEVNGIFNLGSGYARSWNHLVRSVFSAMGAEERIEYIEMPESLKKQYQYYSQADMAKLTRAGYKRKFRSLEEGVRDYVTNYLRQTWAYL